MKAAHRRDVKFGRKPGLTSGQIDHARKLIDKGEARQYVADLLNVGRSTLDGLRAIAITFVIAAHASQRGVAWMPLRLSGYLTVLAYTGLRIFFVLSGFLITSLLLREFNKTGTVSLSNFYWRRTLRIFPAMYAFLIAIGVGYAIGITRIHQDSPFSIFSAAAYISDYIQARGWLLHHT